MSARQQQPLERRRLPPATPTIPATPALHPFEELFACDRVVQTTDLHAIEDRPRDVFPVKSGCFTTSIALEDVKKFRHASLTWLITPREERAKVEPIRKAPVTTNSKPDGSVALYRVSSIVNKKVLLTAVTIDLYAPDRGDLRQISASAFSWNTLQSGTIEPNTYFALGDLLYVQELEPTRAAKNMGITQVMKTGVNACTAADFRERWNAKSFTMAARNLAPGSLALAVEALYRNKEKEITHYKLAAEGCRTLPRLNVATADANNLNIRRDTLLTGTLFYPAATTRCFSSLPASKQAKEELTNLALSLSKDRRSPPTFMDPFEAPDYVMKLMKRRSSILKKVKNREEAINWITKSFRLTVPGLNALESEQRNTNHYSTSINISETTLTSTSFWFHISSPNGLPPISKWRNGARLTITAQGSSKHLTALVRGATEADPPQARVNAIASGNAGAQLRNIFQQQGSLRADVHQTHDHGVPDPAEALFTRSGGKKLQTRIATISTETTTAQAFNALYGGPRITIPATNHSVPTSVRSENNTLTLHNKQLAILKAAASGVKVFTVYASFGCGKTSTAVIVNAEETKRKKKTWNVVAGNFNNAVLNAVHATEKLVDYANLPILRLISEFNFRLQQEHSQYDFPLVIRCVFSDPVRLAKLSEEERKTVRHYIEQLDRADDIEVQAIDVLEKQIENLIMEEEKSHSRDERNAIFDLFFKHYQPRRIFTTTATLLSTFRGNSPRAYFRDDIDTILVDEASQLAEATYFAILTGFPDARVVLIGDSMQLAPYAQNTDGTVLPLLANGELLRRIVENRLFPVLPLHGVFRCHPDLTSLLSRNLYQSKLRAMVTAAERENLLRDIAFPNPTYPWSFIESTGVQRPVGTSYANDEEARSAIKIAQRLSRSIDPTEVAIISLYKAQADIISERLQGSSIFVGTADAAQGREFTATILSTCRTGLAQRGDFFGDRLRVNVALSRAREGCIILGQREALTTTDTWFSVLSEIWTKRGHANYQVFADANNM